MDIIEVKTYLSEYKPGDVNFNRNLMIKVPTKKSYKVSIEELELSYNYQITEIIKKLNIIDNLFYRVNELIIVEYNIKFQEKDKIDYMMARIEELSMNIKEFHEVMKYGANITYSQMFDENRTVIKINQIYGVNYDVSVFDSSISYFNLMQIRIISFKAKNCIFSTCYFLENKPYSIKGGDICSIYYFLHIIDLFVSKSHIEYIPIIDLSKNGLTKYDRFGIIINEHADIINDLFETCKIYKNLKKIKIGKIILPKQHGVSVYNSLDVLCKKHVDITIKDIEYLENEFNCEVYVA